MGYFLKITFVILTLIIIGGTIFFTMKDIPAPVKNIEIIIDNKQFPN